MRRRRASRGRLLMLPALLLLAAAAAASWFALGGPSHTHAPPAAAVHAPPLLRHGALRPHIEPNAPPPGISLAAPNPVHVGFAHPPRAGVLFDVHTGQVLWARNPLRRLPIASTTKIMTAILVVERTARGDRSRITHEALSYSGSGVGVLPHHGTVPVEGLLAGMLLPSGNDAALALADHVAGTNARFARLMNTRARSMGLGCTHYVSADGLEPANRSCPADLAALARVAIAKPRIARIVRKDQAHVPFPIKTGHLWLNSTNPLLHMHYRGTIGLKTGSTNAAGHCFVGIVRRGGREYGVVLLHSPDTGAQAKQLLDAAFRLR